VSPAWSGDDVALLLRAAFLIGALTDGLAIVPMLSSRVGGALFGGDPGRASREYRYAMGIGASLMAGWTVLLLWGAASPFERRDLLVLTVFPVVAGIVAASVVASRRGVVKAARMVPLWIHLSLISALYLVAYRLSAPFAP
jgi:undecaprenyl pyrophosphate phosphatase UppP